MALANGVNALVQIFGFLGLGAVGIAAVVGFAWGAFKVFSGKWLEAKFAERLADYQHRQSLQSDSFRNELATLLDRSVKLHAMEFEVVSAVWKLFAEALGHINLVTSSVKSYADVRWMSSVELDALLEKSEFKDFEKELLRSADERDRVSEYQKLIDKYAFNAMALAYTNFNNELIAKGIFLPPQLRKVFRELSNESYDHVENYRFLKEDVGPKADKWKDFRLAGKALNEKAEYLQELISARFWDREAPKN